MTRPDGTVETGRQRCIRLLALATKGELAEAYSNLAAGCEVFDLKPSETGLVMVRGRIGGDGAPFNAGEATVTRAIVQVTGGAIGYGVRLGRAEATARNAAVLDALWQDPTRRNDVETRLLLPVETRIATERATKRREVAATRVNFFTMARETT